MSEETSSTVAPSNSLGSCTVTENSSGPFPTEKGIGVIVKSRILSSGSGRGARGGFVLANPSAGRTPIRPMTQHSTRETSARCPAVRLSMVVVVEGRETTAAGS